jgi:hypothetical protein
MRLIPRDPRFTLLLVVLFALLAIYIIWRRDPIGYVILALLVLFIALPAVVIFVGLRREGRRLRDILTPSEDEDAARDRDSSSY